MDLTRMTWNDRLKLCKRYFYIGFAGLPWLWLVNSIWFGHFVFIRGGQVESKSAAAAARSRQQNARRPTDPSPIREAAAAAAGTNASSPSGQQQQQQQQTSGTTVRKQQMVAQLENGEGSGNITTTTTTTTNTPTRPTYVDIINQQQAERPSQEQREEETRKYMLRQLRHYVIFSFIGSMAWLVGLIAWVVVYQTKRVEWGEWGDAISFNIPRGIP